jgi:hypothetical protein
MKAKVWSTGSGSLVVTIKQDEVESLGIEVGDIVDLSIIGVFKANKKNNTKKKFKVSD